MITQDTLDNIRNLILERRVLLRMIQDFNYGGTGKNLDGMPHGCGISDPVFRDCEKLSQLRNKLTLKVAELSGILCEVETGLWSLPPDERNIVRLYYYMGKGDKDIAGLMLLNFDTVGRKRRKAVSTLCRTSTR